MWKVWFLSFIKVTVSKIGLIKISLEYFNFNVTIISSFLFVIQTYIQLRGMGSDLELRKV